MSIMPVQDVACLNRVTPNHPEKPYGDLRMVLVVPCISPETAVRLLDISPDPSLYNDDGFH